MSSPIATGGTVNLLKYYVETLLSSLYPKFWVQLTLPHSKNELSRKSR
jgi:hypothetical protein